jgi:hypothetical protein
MCRFIPAHSVPEKSPKVTLPDTIVETGELEALLVQIDACAQSAGKRKGRPEQQESSRK